MARQAPTDLAVPERSSRPGCRILPECAGTCLLAPNQWVSGAELGARIGCGLQPLATALV